MGCIVELRAQRRARGGYASGSTDSQTVRLSRAIVSHSGEHFGPDRCGW